MEKIEREQAEAGLNKDKSDKEKKGLSRRKKRRLEKLQQDLELGRLEGDDKTKAEEDVKW